MNYYEDFYEGLNDNRSVLFRQIDTVAILNKLLSTISSELHNLKNYYINITGENNYVYKTYLEETIKIFNDLEDKLIILIKSKNGFPILQIGDIENISLIKTIPSMDYKSSQIHNNLNNELKIIIKLVNESISSAQKENDYTTITLLATFLFSINETYIKLPS